MDLLRTLLIYMMMLFATSIQSAPDMQTVLEQIATPAPEVTATPSATPVPTPTPTPVPTIAISPNPEYGTLRMGDNGEEVLNLQTTLAEYGYYTGELDGRFGNQTRVAVEQFQYNHGLMTDGIAGRNTLTVLYDSHQVRFASPTPSPSPTPPTLGVAITPPPTATPTLSPTPTPSVTETPRPIAIVTTDTPTDAPQAAALQAEAPAATDPTASPEPTIQPMEGWTIALAGKYTPLSVAGENADEMVAIPPYSIGDEVYVPLIALLQANDVYVILSDSVDLTEYAFVLGDDLYRITYGETQAGDPTDLAAYKNNAPQLLPHRDIQLGGNFIYLPMDSVTSLTGILFSRNDEVKEITVSFPGQVEG